jgi:hypothetical protein
MGIVQRRHTTRQFGAGSGFRGGQFGVRDVEQRLVEHHLVAGMFEGESHVGQGRVGEVTASIVQRLGQERKALSGQRGEQAAAIDEVVGRRGMRHARTAGQLARR